MHDRHLLSAVWEQLSSGLLMLLSLPLGSSFDSHNHTFWWEEDLTVTVYNFPTLDTNPWVWSRLILKSQTTYRGISRFRNHNVNRSFYEWDFWIASTTSVMVWNLLLSFRSIFAKLRASRSQSARLAASLIDSKSSTWATPTILLVCKETHFRVQHKIKTRRILIYFRTQKTSK